MPALLNPRGEGLEFDSVLERKGLTGHAAGLKGIEHGFALLAA
jgi:hypothetical protein